MCLLVALLLVFSFFFFNAPATTEIYTLSLHDALPISGYDMSLDSPDWASIQYQNANNSVRVTDAFMETRSEEHTSELQSHSDLVCRLLLEKKKKENRNWKTRTNKHKHTRRQTTNTSHT